MFDPSYPAFPILACISFVLVLIPLPWHFQAWNSGTCLYMIWTALGCLNLFVNSIVWSHDAIDRAPVWCDISSRLTVGVAVAIPAASLCINRRLYKIATVQTITISRAHKRRAVMIDLAIGLGIPIVQMALQYIVEGHRYNIWENIGCYPATFNTPLAYPLSIVWPSVIGLISGIYCVLTLRAFMRRRAQFSEFLSSNTSLTLNRYFRLMALATTELIFTTPISAYGIYLSATQSPINPWRGFADAHFDYSKVDQFPAIVWRANHQATVTLELGRWLMVVCALLFFAFFGFADEAKKHYRMAYLAITKKFGMVPLPLLQSHPKSMFKDRRPTLPVTQSVGSLPVYTPRASSPTNQPRWITLASKGDSASTLESTECRTPTIASGGSSPADLSHYKTHI